MELIAEIKETHKRIQAKGWFLTYPRCYWTKELVLERLGHISKIAEFVVCLEHHLDGTPHIHAFIKYENKISYDPVKACKFDLDDLHGNYQVAKSWKAVINYCKKGADFITNIDVESAKQKRGKNNQLILALDPLEAAKDGEIRWQEIGLLHKTQELIKFLGHKRSPSEELDLPKKRHYWIYGASNTGKTYKRESLQLEWGDKEFQIPTNNDFSGYNKEKYLWIDEYKGQLTVQQLNSICDGGVKLNTKGSSVKLHRRPIVYVFSNYSIRDTYKNLDSVLLDSLYNRFNEEELTIKYI